MAIDLTTIQKDLSRVTESLSEALSRMKYGSYADRTPHLGRMVTRPCGHRRRQFDVENVCCNHQATETIRDRQAEGVVYMACPPRVTEFSMKKLIKKMQVKHHSNKRRHQIHDMALELQDETRRRTTLYALEGLHGFHDPSRDVDVSGVPALAEKVVVSIRKHKSNRRRRAQQTARRINFGLINGRNG